MDKYRRIPRAKEPAAEGEIRITATGRIGSYVTYAAKLFNEDKRTNVLVKATGTAIARAVTLTEVLKRRFSNLHQLTKCGTTTITDMYEPLEEGLDQVEHSRTVSFIEITLSKEDNLDKTDVGYQGPVDQSLVKDYQAEDFAPRFRGRGRGHGGMTRGTFRGRGGRGRGRGGAVADSHEEKPAQEEKREEKKEAPRSEEAPRGRGGRGGRGRGRGRGGHAGEREEVHREERPAREEHNHEERPARGRGGYRGGYNREERHYEERGFDSYRGGRGGYRGGYGRDEGYASRDEYRGRGGYGSRGGFGSRGGYGGERDYDRHEGGYGGFRGGRGGYGYGERNQGGGYGEHERYGGYNDRHYDDQGYDSYRGRGGRGRGRGRE